MVPGSHTSRGAALTALPTRDGRTATPLLGTHTAPHFLTDHTPMDSNLLKLTGCWESETKNGKRMLKGSIRPGLSLLLLENTEATGNQPQWTAFLAPSGEGKGQSDDQAPAASAF